MFVVNHVIHGSVFVPGINTIMADKADKDKGTAYLFPVPGSQTPMQQHLSSITIPPSQMHTGAGTPLTLSPLVTALIPPASTSTLHDNIVPGFASSPPPRCRALIIRRLSDRGTS